MGWESFNIELFILLLIEVTEERLHNWKAFYKIKLLIFNFPHLMLMAKLLLKCCQGLFQKEKASGDQTLC